MQRVREQLDRGVPLHDVIDRLAGSLATSIATLLGVSVDAAKHQLTQAFSQALAPPGGTPPGSNAERALALATRFRRIAELATRVTNGDPGQPIRPIAGTSLDAETAKANPAPQPDRILNDALVALAAPASSAAVNPVNAVTPAAPAARDGRTVAIDSSEAIASGGDTLLGRILTRAALADASRTAPAVASSTDVPAAQPSGTKTAPLPGTAGPTAFTPGPPATQTANVLDAFVHAFAAAVERNDGNGPRANPDGGSVPASLVANPPFITNPPTPPPLPFAIPVAHDAGTIVATPPTPPPLPQTAQGPDANAIVDQVLRGVSLRTSDGSSTVRLRLVPENLGDVSVKLVVTGGSVDASITAHSVEAQNALAGGQAQLARTLADAGLKLQSFSVGLAGGGFADTREHTQRQSPSRTSARRVGGIDSVDVDGTDDAALVASPTFGPPIYAANPSNWGYDYLV